MRSLARLALIAFALSLVVAVPEAAHAVCASGGTISNLNDCVPVGKGGKDCYAEWSVTLANGSPPPLDNNGFPDKKITCVDNDPTCDRDVTPGQCTFSVGLCVNVAETRFSCTPTSADLYELKNPSEKDTLKKAHKNPFFYYERKNLLAQVDSIVPTASPNVCSDEAVFVVPMKVKYNNGVVEYKKGKGKIGFKLSDNANNKDSDTLKFTCLPNETDDAVPDIDTQPIASARQIAAANELIGGPLAMGQVGDYLIENDKVRFIVRDVGRDFSFMLTYGGHIIDADLQRETPTPGSPFGPPYPAGNDNFLAMTPLVNISSTDNPQTITIVNSGASGGDAVLRTEGPDDLFDAIDPDVAVMGAFPGLGVPASANDVDIPANVVSEYTLSPGDNFIKMETILENTGGSNEPWYIGDYTEAGGQIEVVAPGLGFGDSAIRAGGDVSIVPDELTFNYLGWVGFGDGAGLSYALIPELFNATGMFGQSGIFVPIYGQKLISVLFSGAPPVLSAPPGGQISFTRWFTLSENGMGQVVDARHTLIQRGEIPLTVVGSLGTATLPKLKTGVVRGIVTVNGTPVDGARVVIGKKPGNNGAQTGLVSEFETRDGGFYQGTLPKGEYVGLVKVPGHPFEGGSVPIEHPFKIGGGTTSVDFNVGEAAHVQVLVEDSFSDPIAAKVSVVGLNLTADPGVKETLPQVTMFGNLFGYDAREKVEIYGVPALQFAGPDGDTGVFDLPPGDYQFVVSHGPEYDAYKTGVMTLAGGGAPTVINATLNRVVDTSGYVSTDHHVHMLNSPDSTVSRDERIITMLAEGVDYFVNTDHDFIHSLADEIANVKLPSGGTMDVSSLIGNAPSDEITTFDEGHFNAYPLPVGASVTGNAVDWSDATTPVGLGYPSDGAYDLSPGEFGMLVKGSPYNAIVFQANHFNSGTLGFFRLHGIDTTMAPPQSSVDPNEVRLDPLTTNTYLPDELTALEIWIESSISQNALAVGENMGDWFNMLNNFDSSHPELRKGGIADSDSHSRTIVQAGGPRTMVASAAGSPGTIVPADDATALNEGRAVMTNGPFVHMVLQNESTLDEASHDVGDPQIVAAFPVLSFKRVKAIIDVHSPTWAPFDKVELFISNVPSCSLSAPNFVGASKNVCTPTKPAFNATYMTFSPTVSTVAGVDGGQQLEAHVETFVNAPVVTDDFWVVAVVSGTDNVSAPMFPINPQSTVRKYCSLDKCRSCTTAADCSGGFGSCTGNENLTVSDLATVTATECGVRALAITNPLFVDVDGDGMYKGVAIP
jgi:hypothetical protein